MISFYKRKTRLADGKQIVGRDNFPAGQREFLQPAFTNPEFRLIEGGRLDGKFKSVLHSGFVPAHRDEPREK